MSRINLPIKWAERHAPSSLSTVATASGRSRAACTKGETPSFDRKRVAAEPIYNMATGASILAGKWRATKCVGDNQPSIVEHWYTAVWAYNGLAYSNNPSNPSYSSSRGVWNPKVGGAAPYQEKVFGRVEYPSGSPEYWPSVKLAYPNPATVGGSGAPPDLAEPSCASPTDCANQRGVHASTCFSTGTGGAGGCGGAAAAAALVVARALAGAAAERAPAAGARERAARRAARERAARRRQEGAARAAPAARRPATTTSRQGARVARPGARQVLRQRWASRWLAPGPWSAAVAQRPAERRRPDFSEREKGFEPSTPSMGSLCSTS